MVFGNNTASDVSKLSKTVQNWKILKYYEPVLLPNTTCTSCYSLFNKKKREIVGNAQMTFLFTVEKTQASAFVTIFLRRWKK